MARLRAEGVTCGLGLPGEREREEEADRAGLGSGPRGRENKKGPSCFGFGLWVPFYFSFFSISNSNNSLNSKQSLNSNHTQIIKIMHQHECNTKVLILDKILIT